MFLFFIDFFERLLRKLSLHVRVPSACSLVFIPHVFCGSSASSWIDVVASVFLLFCFRIPRPPQKNDSAGRNSAARTEDDDDSGDWAVSPSHLSQLKEQYRRDRAKNRKGLVARKWPFAVPEMLPSTFVL
jgi:hypothetical protein